MPMNMADYDPAWRAISRRIRERAGNRCERCGVANGAIGARDHAGTWHDERMINGMNSDTGYAHFGYDAFPTIIRIILTTAHLDHDRSNNADDNLQSLCQACHLRHDRVANGIKAAQTRARKRGQMTFEDAVAVMSGED